MSLPNIIILLVNMLQILMKRRLPRKPRELDNGNRREAAAPSSCCASFTFQSGTAKGRKRGGQNTVGRRGEGLPWAVIPRPRLPGLGILSSHEPGAGVCDLRSGTVVGWLSTAEEHLGSETGPITCFPWVEPRSRILSASLSMAAEHVIGPTRLDFHPSFGKFNTTKWD